MRQFQHKQQTTQRLLFWSSGNCYAGLSFVYSGLLQLYIEFMQIFEFQQIQKSKSILWILFIYVVYVLFNSDFFL